MRNLLLFLLLFATIGATAQKKVLDHPDFKIWKSIDDEAISRDGNWVTYALESNTEDDPITKLHNIDGKEILTYKRGSNPQFDYGSGFLFFTIKPQIDSLKDLKRIKTKKADLPMDSLGIYNLNRGELTKIERLKSYKIPQKWSDWIVYQYEPQKDTSKAAKKQKKRNKENGYELVIKSLTGTTEAVFTYVTDYKLSEKGGKIAFVSSGNDSTFLPGVYVFDTQDQKLSPVFRSKGKYKQLNWSESGNQLTFISDLDTTKALLRNYDLHLWNSSMDSAITVLSNGDDFLGQDYIVSNQHKNYFSENDQYLFFGKSGYPILEDTTLLENEIVNVEVWSYTDGKLHTQQKMDKEEDEQVTYLSGYNISSNSFFNLAGMEIPDVQIADEGNSNNIIGYNSTPYHQLISWEGFPYYNDFYALGVTGEKKQIATKIRATPSMSPIGKFAYWYDRMDSAWFTYEFASSEIRQITKNTEVPFYQEIHDTPSFPGSYGIMSWTENDNKVLIYDRYDIWEVDPKGVKEAVKLTSGRSSKISHRYIKTDDEERFVSKNQKLLIRTFNENDKTEGLGFMSYKTGAKVQIATSGDFRYRDIKKAQDGDNYIYSQQNFEVFPDLLGTKNFKKSNPISKANPQQSDYNWGTAELIKWTSLDGIELEGMLIKPENFDPNKKYPMIVNFYERSSNGLNAHRAPSPGRSTINYSFYTSRGYIIFNPNVQYREGYPGESAYNCVIPGVTKLIDMGFVDNDRIGVQGHSWGGYQIAYLVTKTDIFKCAEAGAPVPNMISAYGGIRWWTGLSRMFQYEHTQSRIGGTLWEYPNRYIENSPIFYIDKINTPVLIMHNDADGHVPWYQGIEFFVSLRRLGKPSWMLNYQGEPHWPLKLQNRIDFNIRMAQYFDHYLKDAPMPKWMKSGVSAREMGIQQNYELMKE